MTCLKKLGDVFFNSELRSLVKLRELSRCEWGLWRIAGLFYREQVLNTHSNKTNIFFLTIVLCFLFLLSLLLAAAHGKDKKVSNVRNSPNNSKNVQSLPSHKQSKENNSTIAQDGAKYNANGGVLEVTKSDTGKSKAIKVIYASDDNIPLYAANAGNLEFKSLKKKKTKKLNRLPWKVSQVINGHNAEIQECYQKVLKLKPKLKGKISVRIFVSLSGAVSEVQVVSSTLNNTEFETAVLNCIGAWDDFGECGDDIGEKAYIQEYVFGDTGN